MLPRQGYAGLLLAVVALLGMCTTSTVAQVCAPPKSVTCSMVDWNVNTNLTNRIRTNNEALQIEIGFSNFVGNRQCKKRYKDLTCRFMFPKCAANTNKNSRPCRKECLAFASACPGALMSCNAYPTTDCYTFDWSPAATSTQFSAPFLAALLLALALLF